MAADSLKRAKSKTELETKMHYPWLITFDKDVKDWIRENDQMEITVGHVLKLLTFLETQISSEVSKLKNKPNRATKFLGFIKKRINMVKLSGQLVESDVEHELFPTYGLLMTHYVNITLVSSKMEKILAKDVAADLYFILKLMFHGDTEYVLDVILCSNLAEHAGEKNEIGFQIFSFVIEDWRTFSDNNSSMVRYCAIASLLQESKHGRSFVRRNLPASVPQTLIQHLVTSWNFKSSSQNTFLGIIDGIKPRRVIASSRRRLIVVSESHFAKKKINSDGTSDLNSNSTVRNVVGSSTSNEPGSSKSQKSQDVLNEILGDLGVNFFIDTSSQQTDEKLLEFGETFSWSTDDAVSSSTVNQQSLQSQPDIDGYLSQNIKEEVVDDDDSGSDTDVDDKQVANRNKSLSHSDNATGEMSPKKPENSSDKEGAGSDQETDSKPKKFEYSEQESDMEVDDNEQDEYDRGDEYFSEIEEEVDENDLDSDYEVRPKKLRTCSVVEFDQEEDSDLEIVSENVSNGDGFSKDDDELSIESRDRDEAEPESGEDFVPNYKEDTDDESNFPDSESHQVIPREDSKDEISEADEADVEMTNENETTLVTTQDSGIDETKPIDYEASPSKNSDVGLNECKTVTVNMAMGNKCSATNVDDCESPGKSSAATTTVATTLLRNGSGKELTEPDAGKSVEPDVSDDNIGEESVSQSTPLPKKGRLATARRGRIRVSAVVQETPIATRRSTRTTASKKAPEMDIQQTIVEDEGVSESDNESLASNSTKPVRKSVSRVTKATPARGRGRGRGRGTSRTTRSSQR